MFGVLVSIFPFYWMLVMASNTTPDIFTYPPKLLIGSHLFENMGNVLDNIDFFGVDADHADRVRSASRCWCCSSTRWPRSRSRSTSSPAANVLFGILLVARS